MTYKKFVNRKTIPTACRFCGKRVFYHTNDYGSRVFFDELGGTWPIHDCNGYSMSKNEKGSNYSRISGKSPKSGIALDVPKGAFKPNAILIKKNFTWELV